MSDASLRTRNKKVNTKEGILNFCQSGEIVHRIAGLSGLASRIARKTSTAELLAAADAVDKVTFLKRFHEESVGPQITELGLDSKSAVCLCSTTREPEEIKNKLLFASNRIKFNCTTMCLIRWVPGQSHLTGALSETIKTSRRPWTKFLHPAHKLSHLLRKPSSQIYLAQKVAPTTTKHQHMHAMNRVLPRPIDTTSTALKHAAALPSPIFVLYFATSADHRVTLLSHYIQQKMLSHISHFLPHTSAPCPLLGHYALRSRHFNPSFPLAYSHSIRRYTNLSFFQQFSSSHFRHFHKSSRQKSNGSN